MAPMIGFALPRSAEHTMAFISIAIGAGILSWATYEQWTRGRGTPAQSAPTQALITSGPYALCRNPIELGAVIYYLGFGTLMGSIFHGLVVCVLGLLGGSYYHFTVEEAELEQRFGVAYVEYRKCTPFLIPRLWKQRR